MNKAAPRLHARQCRGFSLLEILVAFVIMALTLGVLLQVFSSGLRTAMVAEEYGEATRLAGSLLTEVSVVRPLERGERSGEFEGTPYRWQVAVAPLSMQALAPNASERFDTLEIVVRVSWAAGRGERDVELRSLRLEARP